MHDIIIIITKGECVAEKTEQLKGYAEEIDELVQSTTGEPPEGSHELLERIQAFFTTMCDGESLTNVEETLDALIEDAEDILGI